jgi:uncharacterized protein (DUF1778 family)
MEGGMKIMITLRVDENLKEFFQRMAEKERRSLTNYLVNAAIVYAEEHLGADWEKEAVSAEKEIQ